MHFSAYTLLALAALQSVSATLQIVPGATWTASNGAHLQAHGGGIIEVGGTYYLVGEDKTNGSAFQNVNCYSSTDLVQWHYEGALLSVTTSGDLGPSRVIERPKVIYNDKTRKYVLWMHVDSSSYGEAKVGVATGDTVCGSYTYQGSFQPLDHQSRDTSLFKDDDGAAYLLSEDRANGLRIMRLTDDYLAVANSTYLWPDHIEAPAVVKVQGRYYMFGSHLTGWDANDNVVSSSTSLSSGWTPWATFADVGSKTYTSQTNYILQYGDTIVYLGDRWVSTNLKASTYVWLPLNISGTSVSMANHAAWVPPSGREAQQTVYTSSTAVLASGARNVDCSACSGSKAAGYIGGPSHGTATFTFDFTAAAGTANDLTTLVVRYGVSETSGRLGTVRVNDGAPIQVAFLRGSSSGNIGQSVLTVRLNSGTNKLEFGGVGDAYGPDIDTIQVPSN